MVSAASPSVRLAVRAHPGARRARVELREGVLEVWVTARPVQGEANAAISAGLAAALGVRPSAIVLVRGLGSRQKVVEVPFADLAAVRARLVAQDSHHRAASS